MHNYRFPKLSHPAGVYCIKNTVNGKFYIGSSVDIKKRWYHHRFKLSNSTHDNSILQNAWIKYGQLAFVFEVVEYVFDNDRLIATEQHHIDLLTPAYNICKVAGAVTGRKHSEDTKRKISEGIINTLKSRIGFVSPKKGVSMSEDQLEKIKVINALPWSKERREKQIKSLTGRRIPKEQVERTRLKLIGKKHPSKYVPVVKLSRDMQFLEEFESLTDAARKTGLKKSSISVCTSGFAPTYAGFVWMRKSDYESKKKAA